MTRMLDAFCLHRTGFLGLNSGNLCPLTEKAVSFSSRFNRVSSFLALIIHQ